MEIARYAALILIFFVCAMPLKRGNMLSNDVTPAPPMEFITDVLGVEDRNSAQELVTTPASQSQDEHLNQVPEPRVENHDEEDNHMTDHEMEGERTGQPVCLYGFPEIFLSQHRTGLIGKTWSAHAAKITETGRSAGNFTQDMTKNETDHEEEEQTELDKTGSDSSVEAVKIQEKEGLESVDSMQSFEEWKSLKLQEQEVRKAEELLTPPVHIVRTKKTQVNYASQDCGAKILGHNKEAKHVSAILDENRDMYMLNPCSANIWFVIELCEPIQVQQLQLCNLELFSSAPKDFMVSVSERYPARDWHTLGTFHASNDRNLQTFSLNSEEQMFAKYIKFDMQSHFSNEHFCPLTLVRVLGVSMVDEFDESEQANSKDDVAEESAVENDGSKDGAINTVFNMVKNAVDHVLNNGPENAGVDESLTETQMNSSEDDTGDSIDPAAESEVILVTNQTEVASTFDNNATQDFITIIKMGNGEDISEYIKNFSCCSTRQIPLYMPRLINLFNPLTTKLNIHMCWFLEFFCKVSLAGCLVHYPYNYSCLGLFIPIQGLSKVPSLPEDNVLRSDNEEKEGEEKGRRPIEVDTTNNENASTNSEATNSMTKQPVHAKNTAVDGEANKTAMPAQDTDTGQNILTGGTEVQIPALSTDGEPDMDLLSKTQVMNGNNGKAEDGVDKSARSDSFEEVKPEHIVEMVKDHDSSKLPEKEKVHSGSNSTPHNSTDAQPQADITQNATVKNATNENVVKNISGANTTLGQPTVVINPGTNQKDSVFMRLSNRIRALEQNMSLSSDYLETLSQRYKKQMDEMQRAFNQTTSKLISMGKRANESDARQNVSLQMAFAEIEMLTDQVKNLSLSHDQLNMQLVERHMCLIILEFLIFIVVFVTCLGRRVSQIENDLHRAENMNKKLMEVLKKLENNPKTRAAMANGHCVADDHKSDSLLPRGSKRKRNRAGDVKPGRIHGHAGKNGIRHKIQAATGNGMKGDTKIHTMKTLEHDEVELIDKDPRWTANERSCNGGWNGHPLALKLPNGHSKGRK